MSDKRYTDKIERLRSPERIARYEIEKMIGYCLEDAEIESVLDVGTGSGLFAESFSRKGLSVAGADVNPEMVAAAKDFVPSAQFTVAPAEKLPFADQSFDLVFMACVFHEVDDHVQTLKEARRIARRRIAILEYPYAEQPFGPPMHHRLKPEQVEAFARQAELKGMRTVEMTSVNLYIIDTACGINQKGPYDEPLI
jgi:ubiquinone/menaquinone biosynthesis C-methylase UbiE